MARNLSDAINKADFRLRNTLHDARKRGGCMIALLALPVALLAALAVLT